MKTLMTLVAYGAGLYGLILFFFFLMQEKMIFFPGPGRFNDCPAMARINAEAVTDGTIRYYALRHPEPACWIIIFHGNAGSACDRTYFAELLSGMAANLAVFEYPGYGGDGENPGQALILERAAALVHHIGTIHSDGLPVYLLGESLGCGVAVFVATQKPVAGLILISAYPSLARVAASHYPWLPVRLLMRHPFPAAAWASRTEVPALMFHGTADDIIPLWLGREQAAAFAGEKELVEIPGAGHNDITDTGRDIIREKISRFIREAG